MSDLEDLGDIADQNALGACGASNRGFRQGHRPALARCGSPDHMKGANIRVYRKTPNGKLRTVCRLCDKARRNTKPTYSAQGYPL